MAKKSQNTRTSAVRRTANAPAAARRPQATLVPINPVEKAQSLHDNGNGKGGAATATLLVAPVANKQAAPALTTQPTKTPAKSAVAKATSAASSVKIGKAAVRAAAQQINPRRTQIRAENYGYVIKDLRVIAGVAVFMLVVMVVLHFVLPS